MKKQSGEKKPLASDEESRQALKRIVRSIIVELLENEVENFIRPRITCDEAALQNVAKIAIAAFDRQSGAEVFCRPAELLELARSVGGSLGSSPRFPTHRKHGPSERLSAEPAQRRLAALFAMAFTLIQSARDTANAIASQGQLHDLARANCLRLQMQRCTWSLHCFACRLLAVANATLHLVD